MIQRIQIFSTSKKFILLLDLGGHDLCLQEFPMQNFFAIIPNGINCAPIIFVLSYKICC
jgi:hypothetical protein